jgi:hypothetical protein
MSEAKQQQFDEWAKVELMGRQVVVGRVTEATLGGGAFLRVDVPELGTERAFTRFYRPEAIYCISPVSEEVARALLARFHTAPVSRYELPAPDPEEDENDGEHQDGWEQELPKGGEL